MVEHVFGGDWTEAKLERLKAYLEKYRIIFRQNQKAHWFTTWYVDAFAGTGTRSTREEAALTLGLEDPEQQSDFKAIKDGSVRIALGLRDPFDRYLFIEESKTRVDELRTMIVRDFPYLQQRCEVVQGDANDALQQWAAKRDWRKDRAVVFLDPYGMQVDWSTVEVLGSTRGIDLWYLFSLSAVIRMLTKSGEMEESWKRRLDHVFGNSEWQGHFYRVSKEVNLFGESDKTTRDATVANVLHFIENRLKTVFSRVAPSLTLRNSKDFPLFALCFATENQAAINIATHLLRDWGKSIGDKIKH